MIRLAGCIVFVLFCAGCLEPIHNPTDIIPNEDKKDISAAVNIASRDNLSVYVQQTLEESGHVWIVEKTATSVVQTYVNDILPPYNIGSGDLLGESAAISSDGTYIVVGAPGANRVHILAWNRRKTKWDYCDAITPFWYQIKIKEYSGIGTKLWFDDTHLFVGDLDGNISKISNYILCFDP